MIGAWSTSETLDEHWIQALAKLITLLVVLGHHDPDDLEDCQKRVRKIRRSPVRSIRLYVAKAPSMYGLDIPSPSGKRQPYLTAFRSSSPAQFLHVKTLLHSLSVIEALHVVTSPVTSAPPPLLRGYLFPAVHQSFHAFRFATASFIAYIAPQNGRYIHSTADTQRQR
jgi:hypothetical protein